LSRIETAGNVPWASREEVLPHVDTVLHDSKRTDPERHRTWTGVGKMCIRATPAFIRPRQNVIDYELLPHMRFGVSKCGFLGRV
jgi:pyruvate-formate lyase-activating enzyme